MRWINWWEKSRKIKPPSHLNSIGGSIYAPGMLTCHFHTITPDLIVLLFSMWHELRVVLHNREHTLLALAIQAFARDERIFAQAVANNWESLEAAVEDMPVDLIR